jgi:hypothetical protein
MTASDRAHASVSEVAGNRATLRARWQESRFIAAPPLLQCQRAAPSQNTDRRAEK